MNMRYSGRLDFIITDGPQVELKRLKLHDRQDPAARTRRTDAYLEVPGELLDTRTGNARTHRLTAFLGSLEKAGGLWRPDPCLQAWMDRRGKSRRESWNKPGELRQEIARRDSRDARGATREMLEAVRTTTERTGGENTMQGDQQHGPQDGQHVPGEPFVPGELFDDPGPLTFALRVRPEQLPALERALGEAGIPFDARRNMIAVDDVLRTITLGEEAGHYTRQINRHLDLMGLSPKAPAPQDDWGPERRYDLLRLAATTFRWDGRGRTTGITWLDENANWADIVSERELTFQEDGGQA